MLNLTTSVKSVIIILGRLGKRAVATVFTKPLGMVTLE